MARSQNSSFGQNVDFEIRIFGGLDGETNI